MIYILLAGTFISITLIFLSIFYHYKNKKELRESDLSKRVEEFMHQTNEAVSEPFILREKQLSSVPIFNKILEKLKLSKYLESQLEKADLQIKVGRLVIYIIACGVAGYLLSSRSNLMVLRFIAGFMCAWLPLLYINFKRMSRLKAFIREFPDAIDMMTSALKAGHAFSKTMEIVADESPDPMSSEFRKTYDEQKLGLPLKEALLNMANRVDHLDLKLFITAVLLQRETGGNLAEILEKISYTIRERFKLIGQIKVFTAQGRFSAIIISGLPIGFAVIISFINPQYLEPLFQTQIGHMLLGAAFCMELAGFLVIRKITNIKMN